jgi:hypothetical protein
VLAARWLVHVAHHRQASSTLHLVLVCSSTDTRVPLFDSSALLPALARPPLDPVARALLQSVAACCARRSVADTPAVPTCHLSLGEFERASGERRVWPLATTACYHCLLPVPCSLRDSLFAVLAAAGYWVPVGTAAADTPADERFVKLESTGALGSLTVLTARPRRGLRPRVAARSFPSSRPPPPPRTNKAGGALGACTGGQPALRAWTRAAMASLGSAAYPCR